MSQALLENVQVDDRDGVVVASTETTSRAFFSSFEEMINLVAPVLFLLIALPDLFNETHYKARAQIYMNLYANIIWLNALHATFFLSFPFMDKNARSWFTGVKNEKTVKNFIASVGIVVGTFFCFCYTLKVIPTTSVTGEIIGTLGWLFLLVVPVIHYMRQSYGLSRLYDSNHKPRKRTFDFYGYHALLLLLILSKFALLSETVFIFDSLVILKHIISIAVVTICVLVFSAFIGNDFKSGCKKAVFQLRLFLYPMSFFHPLAGIFAKGFHGLEYMYVTKSLTKKQNVSRSFFKIFGTIFLITIMLTLVHHKGLSDIFYEERTMPTWILLCSAGLYSLVQLHYWMDLYLFSLKSQEVVESDTPIRRLKNAMK